jgi:hypothetical protein
MLDIGPHVLHSGLVGGEHVIQKSPVIASRFDAWKQRIERLGDVATES